jgi:hypothetical protein
MRRRFRTLVTTFIVVLMALSVGGFTAAALGAPPARESASISTDGRACTVTGTFAWKNYDPGAVHDAHVTVNDQTTGGGTVASQATEPNPGGSGTVTVTFPGISGRQYQVKGNVRYTDFSIGPVASSRVTTLRCK